MKKVYETPKAELMDFDYTDTVVASGPARTSDYADARSDILEALNKLTEQPLDIADIYEYSVLSELAEHLSCTGELL